MRRALTFVLLAGVVALLPSASASAADAPHRYAVLEGNLGLGRDHVQVWSDARTNLELSVSRENDRGVQSADYVAKDAGRRGINRLEGEIGDLGSISMRFHATKIRRVGSPNCVTSIHARGYLKGRFKFEAENKFVTFSDHRIKARKTVLIGGRHCQRKRRSAGSLGSSAKSVLLIACGEDGGVFSAVSDRIADEHLTLVAAVAPPVLHAGLIRSAFVAMAAPGAAFQPASDLSAATIEPPPPFSGSATYSDADAEISGDLSWRTLSGRNAPVAPAPARMRRGHQIQCPGGTGFGVAGRSAEPRLESALRQLQRDYAPAPAGSAVG